MGITGKKVTVRHLQRSVCRGEGVDTRSPESNDQILVAAIRSKYKERELGEGIRAGVLGLWDLLALLGLIQGFCGFIIYLVFWYNAQTH